MSDFWKQCEGQAVNDEFRLLRVLGSGETGAVFLAERIGGNSERDAKFAIKLLRESSTDAALQLARWKIAADISHPLLLKVFSFGRCQLPGQALIFIVMEYAEESLSEILPQRPLSATEVSEMAGPIVEALMFLHGKGLVHGHLKPANILAAGDHLKLASDGICRAGDQVFGSKQSLYIAPEAVNGTAAPSNDIWALGVTLTETLTQSLPAWKLSGHEDPRLSKPLPPPFDVIVPRCLSYDPQRRWRLSEISKQLTGDGDSKSASARDAAAEKTGPRKKFATMRYTAAFVILIVAAALIGYAVMHRGGADSTLNLSQAHPADLEENGPQRTDAPSPSSASSTPGNPAAKTVAESAPPEGRTGGGSAARGQAGVVSRFLPPVPASARRTIHGRVHVSVNVNVDSDGNVRQASLDSPGPSRYFARLALEASRNWKFAPAGGQSANTLRRWQLRYLFGRNDTTVAARQLD